MNLSKKYVLTVGLLLGTTLGSSAQAHHSFATFDMSKQVTVTGVVKDFQWQNPHTWIYLLVAGVGEPEVWDIEGGPVIGLKRDGWTKDVFKTGDKVTITMHPKRDGTHGGSFMTAITADGKTLGHLGEVQVTPTNPTP